VAEQAQLPGLTERSLEIAFRQKKGTTILLFVQQQLTSIVSIADIALEVGYADASYFNRVFKQTTGISPGRYRSDGQA
jgi:AraC-like DNA-binding protein